MTKLTCYAVAVGITRPCSLKHHLKLYSNTAPASPLQEGLEVPIHVMLQPDYLTARVAALEDLEVYVEDLTFAKLLCSETMAVKRERPMKVRSLACARSSSPVHLLVAHNARLDTAPSKICWVWTSQGAAASQEHIQLVRIVLINAGASVLSAAVSRQVDGLQQQCMRL